MSEISDLIAAARVFADNLTTDANSQLQGAMGVALGLGDGQSDAQPPTFTLNPPQPHEPEDVPEYFGPTFQPVNFSTASPSIAAIHPLRLPTDPGPAPALETYNPPAAPSGAPADASLLLGLPAINVDFTIDDPPNLLAEIRGVEKPVLEDIEIPDAPEYVAPEFVGVRPSSPGAAPTGLDAQYRQQYDTIAPVFRDAVKQELDQFLDREFPQFRTAMAKIETRLATYLDGGSALSSDVEDALYNRTLDKTNADARRAQQEAWGNGARAGHSLPSVTVLAQLRSADQDRRDANARAATEIYIKQAELEQNNLQFAVTASTELRKLAMTSGLSYYGSLVTLNGQALDYAKSVVDAVVRVYDLAVKYSEAQVRIYEAEGRIYESKLRGAQAVIDAYTARVKALEAQADVDTAKVQAYKTFIEAIEAEATVYKSQVDFITAQGQIEKLKVDLYNSKVQAYSAQVNAYTAQFQGYRAAIDGETAKQQASAERFRAYSTKVDAYARLVQSSATELESIARTNESRVRVYAAQADVNRTRNLANSEAVKAQIDSYDTTLKAYLAREEAQATHDRALIEQYRVFLQGVVEQSKLYLDRIRERDTLLVARANAVAGISKDIASQYAAVASSALSGMNTLASHNVSAEGSP